MRAPLELVYGLQSGAGGRVSARHTNYGVHIARDSCVPVHAVFLPRLQAGGQPFHSGRQA